MDKIAISIIIAAYNCAQYLGRCVSSVSQQKIQGKIEVIIVDDASTDSTQKAIQLARNAYEREDFIISTYRLNKNCGPNVARNIAISKARGEFILPVDADDFLFPHALEQLFDIAKKHNTDATIGGVCVLNGKSLREEARLSTTHDYYNISIIDHQNLYIYALSYHYSMLVKTEIIKRNKIHYHEKLIASGDGYYLFSLFFHLNNVSIINKAVYGRTINANSICTKKRSYDWYRCDIFAYHYLYEKALSLGKKHVADIRFSYWLSDFFMAGISTVKKDLCDSDIYKVIEELHIMFEKFDIYQDITQYLTTRLSPAHDLFLRNLAKNPEKSHYIFSTCI